MAIVHTPEWDTPETQLFVGLGLGQDELNLYRTSLTTAGSYESSLEACAGGLDAVECFDYCPNTSYPGLAATGSGTGTTTVLNLLNPGSKRTRLSLKQHRPCNTLAFNASGLLAVGLDRARSDESLIIYDIHSEMSMPLAALLPNEAVTSLRVVPSRQTQFLVGSYKSIREIDTRMASTVLQVPTKYSHGVRISTVDDNRVLSYSETGHLALWDRRWFASSHSHPVEPLLVIPRVLSETRGKAARVLRFSATAVGEYAVLHEGGMIRRWVTGNDQGGPRGLVAPQQPPSLFVSRVVDVLNEREKVVGFDYVVNQHSNRLEFACLRQSGSIFRVPVNNGPEVLRFDPGNSFFFTDFERILKETPDSPDSPKAVNPKANSPKADISNENETCPASNLLASDITSIMRRRAQDGYSCNTEASYNIMSSETPTVHTHLRSAWRWLHYTKERCPSTAALIDFDYAGPLSIWEGVSTLQGQRRSTENVTEAQFEKAVKELASTINVFVAPERAQDPKFAHRKVCLTLIGWHSPLGELENKLQRLEADNFYEKAAAWAVFHGNVERAVRSLAKSPQQNHQVMSTAVAGYFAYNGVGRDNAWRQQCRTLAQELESPYLRAIFAYIADGQWIPVLEDKRLPLTEQLGLAFRFLDEDELTPFLKSLEDQVVAEGNLEGIQLLGLVPRIIDLLQVYVDRTSDVQTAALIASFCVPRLFDDPRVNVWIMNYRACLNSWQLYSQRARFDVARNALATPKLELDVRAPIPKQVFLRCSNCETTIGTMKRKLKRGVASPSRCPNCNHPLPCCAVCLLPLGPTLNESCKLDKWPAFCMSCNHGYHSVHAREWFAKYEICPVPECDCMCGSL